MGINNFEKGSKVVCVNGYHSALTINKQYMVLSSAITSIFIIDDYNERRGVYSHRFISMEAHRSNIINDILK